MRLIAGWKLVKCLVLKTGSVLWKSSPNFFRLACSIYSMAMFSHSSLLLAQSPSIATIQNTLEQSRFRHISAFELQESKSRLLNSLRQTPSDVSVYDWSKLRDETTIAILNDENAVRRLEFLIERLRESDPAERAGLLGLYDAARTHLALTTFLNPSLHSSKELQTEFAARKRMATEVLLQYSGKGQSEFLYDRLAEAVRWFEEHQQAPEFVEVVRRRFSHPNLEVKISASMLANLTSQDLQQTTPIEQTSNGLQIRGTSQSSGTGYLAPVHDSGFGELVMKFQGRTGFRMTSSMRKVRFGSSAATQTNAETTIKIGELLSLSASPTKACACTELCNSEATVCRRVGRRLIGGIVDRVITKKTPEFERELSQQVATRVREELDKEIAELLTQANAFFRDRIWLQAKWLDMFPRAVGSKTSSDRLELSVLVDSASGLAAPNYSAIDKSDCVSLHESLASSLLNALYVQFRPRLPRTLNRDVIERWDERLPKMFRQGESPGKVWVDLELDFPRPFELNFDQNRVCLTLRAKRILLDDEEDSPIQVPFDVTISYRVSVEPDGVFRFDLAHKPQVQPRNLAPAEDRKKLVQAAVLQEFLYGLQPSFVMDVNDFVDSSELPVSLQRIESARGWLAIQLMPNADISSQMTTR